MTGRIHARFLPGGQTLELSAGERVLDVVDDQHALGLLPTACRAGNCGICLVRVQAGARWLDPPNDEERAVLAALGRAVDERLGCQIHVCAALPQQIAEFQVILERIPR